MEKTTVQINGVNREVSFGMFAYGEMIKVIGEHVEAFEETTIDPVTLSGFVVYSGLIGACKVNRQKPDFTLTVINEWLDQNQISQEDFDKINLAFAGSVTEKKLNETLSALSETKPVTLKGKPRRG